MLDTGCRNLNCAIKIGYVAVTTNLHHDEVPLSSLENTSGLPISTLYAKRHCIEWRVIAFDAAMVEQINYTPE
jgi:hypothetical protein